MKYIFSFFLLIGWLVIATVACATIMGAVILGCETNFFSFPERLADKILK